MKKTHFITQGGKRCYSGKAQRGSYGTAVFYIQCGSGTVHRVYYIQPDNRGCYMGRDFRESCNSYRCADYICFAQKKYVPCAAGTDCGKHGYCTFCTQLCLRIERCNVVYVSDSGGRGDYLVRSAWNIPLKSSQKARRLNV